MTTETTNVPANDEKHAADVDAIVVGAGFSGLYMSYRLRALGMRVQGFEAADDVGGTWYWNRYPGARTDSQAPYYCYTWSKELLDDWTWSERYPSQPEVLRYLQHVADRFDLRPMFQFETRVLSATFNEEAGSWTVTTDTGEVMTSRYLITAIGVLSTVNLPDIEGIERFAGKSYHTARWPHEPVDFSDSSVGVIGAGSTGVQILPHLARVAKQVMLFQRTPNYVVPSQNRTLSDDEWRDIRSRHDSILADVRASPFSHPYSPAAPSAKAAKADERAAIYEKGWKEGGFGFLMATFADLLTDVESNETASEFVRSKIREVVKDPETAEILAPKGYPYGVKRPPAGTDYYETFNLPNVSVVDVKSRPIKGVTPSGILVGDEEYKLDVIVYATGFDASTGSFIGIDIRGRDGVDLRSAWADGPRTYLGMGVPGFPNMFMVIGPQVPFGNIPTCVESTVDWIVSCIADARKKGCDLIEVTPAAADGWTKEVNDVAEMTLAPLGLAVNSWMFGANIKGKPQKPVFYFGGANNFMDRCEAVARSGFDGVEMSKLDS